VNETQRHWQPPLPAQVRDAAHRANTLLSAVSRHRDKVVGRGMFRMMARLVAERQAVNQNRNTGRGAFRSQARVAAMLAEARHRLLGRPVRRRGKWVSWVTDGPRLKRKHRMTRRPPWRPKLDNTRLRRAVRDLRTTFRIKRLVAEDQVIATMPGAGTAKDTPRWRRSMRARLRQNNPVP
jgi:hypothetical protein